MEIQCDSTHFAMRSKYSMLRVELRSTANHPVSKTGLLNALDYSGALLQTIETQREDPGHARHNPFAVEIKPQQPIPTIRRILSRLVSTHSSGLVKCGYFVRASSLRVRMMGAPHGKQLRLRKSPFLCQPPSNGFRHLNPTKQREEKFRQFADNFHPLAHNQVVPVGSQKSMPCALHSFTVRM
jgi:hypothetical protein